MSKIFVSYSRHDLEIVDCIVGKIEDTGMKVWIDRDDIKAGKTWRAQIVEAIDTCDAFVLMLSSNSAASDNVRKEVDLAQDSGRTVFIMRLGPVQLPAEMRYELVGLQYIDVPKMGIDDSINQLISTLKEHLASWKSAAEQTVRQTELVLQGDPAEFGAKEREQTIDLISALTDTPASHLDISNLTSGSVHVFVDMPAAAAYELKTRALNRDRRLKHFGIKSLRLVGDRKYVNVSLGILTATATVGFLNLLWMSIPSLFPSIFGITAGKVIVITSALVVTTAMSLAVSERVSTAPVTTPTPQPIPTPTLTRAPQNPLVLQGAYCWTGPGPAYPVVSTVKAGTRVEMLGRGSLAGWWIINNPIYGIPCWMKESDLQINPGDFLTLPIYTPLAPPPPPTENPHDSSNNGPTPIITETPCSPWWACFDFPILVITPPTP